MSDEDRDRHDGERGISPMQQWEYRELDLAELLSAEQESEALNDAGKEGWELAAITANSIAYLKRHLPTAPSVRPPRRKAATPPMK